MNSEANRLATFASWPSHFPVDVRRLARGGFFANSTRGERAAECHWCRQCIDDWHYGDQVMTRHRQLDPLCPFITDPCATDNVPSLSADAVAEDVASEDVPPSSPASSPHQPAEEIEEPDNRGEMASATAGEASSSASAATTTTASATSATNGSAAVADDDAYPDYMNEQCRLNTFTNWPITCVTPRALARAGFYYYNQSDHVRCAWCQGVIAKWEQGDDPHTEHSKFFPLCPRAMCGPNVRMLDAGAGSAQSAGTDGGGGSPTEAFVNPADIAAIGIQPHQASRHAAFASLDVRIQSFGSWPATIAQRPEQLAAAGFFSLEQDDFVRCFHCSGGLRSWQPDDDPWVEHAKYFPRCGFVELVRGRGFVQKVQAALLQRQQHQQRQQQAQSSTSAELAAARAALETAMAGEWPRRALEMGFAERDVRQVVAQRLEMTGHASHYEGIDELVVAILSLKVAAAEMGVEVEAERTVEGTTPTNEDEGAIGGVAASDDLAGSSGSVGSLRSILSGSVNGERSVSLEDENRKLKDAILCKVCMVEEVGIVFLPCGHLVSCVQCATSVVACPLCRTQIKAYVRTYLS